MPSWSGVPFASPSKTRPNSDADTMMPEATPHSATFQRSLTSDEEERNRADPGRDGRDEPREKDERESGDLRSYAARSR